MKLIRHSLMREKNKIFSNQNTNVAPITRQQSLDINFWLLWSIKPLFPLCPPGRVSKSTNKILLTKKLCQCYQRYLRFAKIIRKLIQIEI